MQSLSVPRNASALSVVVVANLFMFFFMQSQGIKAVFGAAVTTTVLASLFCWNTLFDGLKIRTEKSLSVKTVFLGVFPVVNLFYHWSQTVVDLFAILLTSVQVFAPLYLASVSKRLEDGVLFDLAAIFFLYIIPSNFSEILWIASDGTPVEGFGFVVSIVAGVVIFKDSVIESRGLPLALNKVDLSGSVMIVGCAAAFYVLWGALFKGGLTPATAFNWQQVLPFGWCGYLLSAVFIEFIYRALFLNWALKISRSLSFSVFFSALVYGMLESGYLESGDTRALAAAVVFGICSGLAYIKLGSLTVGILAHTGFVMILAALRSGAG